MTLMMAVAAVWGVLQLFAVAWPTRSVRLSTVLLAFAVGVYGCGTATRWCSSPTPAPTPTSRGSRWSPW